MNASLAPRRGSIFKRPMSCMARPAGLADCLLRRRTLPSCALLALIHPPLLCWQTASLALPPLCSSDLESPPSSEHDTQMGIRRTGWHVTSGWVGLGSLRRDEQEMEHSSLMNYMFGRQRWGETRRVGFPASAPPPNPVRMRMRRLPPSKSSTKIVPGQLAADISRDEGRNPASRGGRTNVRARTWG